MRFRVTYQADRIPLHYRMKMYSLIKEAIKIADADYYHKMFEKNKNEMKPFSAAIYLKDFRIEQSHIHLKEFSITVSAEMEFAIHAFNGLRKLTQYEVDGVKWNQTSILLLKESEISTTSVVLSTLSPILVEDKDGKPLSPFTENYETEINYYANLKVAQAKNRSLHQPIVFTPINMRKVVVKESNRIFQQSHPEQSLYYTAYKGMFKLQGHVEDLQLLYQLGLGKKSTFFGLTEVEREGV
ncbi:CRISPR-associated endoribonuclease Cas6 [Longirhabdus pacifica]|uniref:CRISPR-associated endoribonuclease Cas6 n=1 Tax=Longirhabdus pacifica TaxID=2305227 RepID=UPI0010089479|nr:CRISPR-associated endoribonuclease Cas6 [Longirhabdus pacifica]